MASEKLEKLLALANDKSNRYESELAYKMYLKLKNSELKSDSIDSKIEEKKEWNIFDCVYDKDYHQKYQDFFEIKKVDGGYLIRRNKYLTLMENYYMRLLHSFPDNEGVARSSIKYIKVFQNLLCQEFGCEVGNFGDNNRISDSYVNSLGKQEFTGNPKINYLQFVDNDCGKFLELDSIIKHESTYLFGNI